MAMDIKRVDLLLELLRVDKLLCINVYLKLASTIMGEKCYLSIVQCINSVYVVC